MTTFAEDGVLIVALDRVWQASLAASVLVGVVLALQLVLGKTLAPRWRYALWLLVVARLLMPVAPASSSSLFNWVGWQSKRVVRANTLAPQGGRGTGETRALRSPVLAPQAVRDARVAPISPPIAPARPGVPSTPSWQNALAGGWLIGAAGCWLLVLVQHWRLANALKREEPISDTRFLSLLDGCKAALRLRMVVRAIETPRVSTPAVFGFVRPRLLLPKGMLDTWEEPTLRHVILHELVHVRRGDVLLNWVLILAQGLHWFNPVVWSAFRRLHAERELVCDGIVLSHLSPEDRRAYGSTLIKLVQTFSQPVRVPSLAPILIKQNEIERRMTMISQFQPSTRRAAFALTVLLLALVCFTFTRAAEKEASKVFSVPRPASNAQIQTEKEADRRGQGIRALEVELAKQTATLAEKQRLVDKLKEHFQIAQGDAASESGAGSLTSEKLRRLEMERITAESDYQRVLSLYQRLTNHSRLELRRILPTAAPDSFLDKRLEELATTELRLAQLTNTLGFTHPEVKAARSYHEVLDYQVDTRVDGVLAGLKVKSDAMKSHLDSLKRELEDVRKKDIADAQLRQPYYQARRELENLHAAVERLQARLWQEKVDAALPPTKAQ